MARSRTLPTLATMAAAAVAALPLMACNSKPTGPSTPTSTLTITSVTPSAGGVSGGTAISITGTQFGSDATVTVDGTPATAVTVTSTTTLTAVTPAHAAGVAAVVVTSGGKSATSASGFTFVAPTGTNHPPVVASIISSDDARPFQPSGFGDIGETLKLAVTVTDSDTPAAAMTYAWSAPLGTITGTGANGTWILPATLASTPVTVTATLKVTESYTEGGVVQRNITTATFPVSVHDSQNEILDMGQKFLERFSQSNYTPDQVLEDFSTNLAICGGREDEAGDVKDNRTYFHQEPGWSVKKIPPVTFNFRGFCDESALNPPRLKRADACSAFAVHWFDTRIAIDPDEPGGHIGDHGETIGTDFVTAVLDDDKWYLCHSDFLSTQPAELLTGFAKMLLRKHGGDVSPFGGAGIR
jgi:hypothetical protein